MNEYYSAELSRKIKRGMRENAIKGKTTGGNVALGYRIGADKQMEIDPAGAALVRRIFTSYDSGMTFTEICDDLNHAATLPAAASSSALIPSPNPCQPTIHRDVQCAGEDAHCPPIIEPELFRSVQERLTESRHKHRHTQSPHEYVLTGKAICGTCGRRLTGRAGTSKTDKRYYYYCCPNKCCGWLPAAELEHAVLDAIAHTLLRSVRADRKLPPYALDQQSTHEKRPI